jgi:hypothetical protein
VPCGKVGYAQVRRTRVHVAEHILAAVGLYTLMVCALEDRGVYECTSPQYEWFHYSKTHDLLSPYGLYRSRTDDLGVASTTL